MENEELKYSGIFCRLISEKFLCCVSVKKIDWQDILKELSTKDEDESLKLQNILLAETVNHPLNQKYPLKLSYQLGFLKYIILTLEERGVEVSEDLYSKFQELLQSPPPSSDFSFKHYKVADDKFVTLKESTSIVSEGTTGLCSWQGAFVLAEWCLENSVVLNGKGILELGSGIGLTGLVVCKTCLPKYVAFTDVHESVLKQLCSNININTGCEDNFDYGPEDQDVLLNILWEGKHILVAKLDWFSFDLDSIFCELDFPDVLLAADVVYDPSLITPLCKVLNSFFEKKKDISVIFACTIRNQGTHELFLETLGSMGMTPKLIPFNSKLIFHYDLVGNVLLYSIHKET
nr:PREDICTED: protein-lysine N-methyltransferase EEF2KMT-like [Bemisia tabaci]